MKVASGGVRCRYADYIIVDRTVIPVETSGPEFSEALLVLPRSYQINDYHVTGPRRFA